MSNKPYSGENTIKAVIKNVKNLYASISNKQDELQNAVDNKLDAEYLLNIDYDTLLAFDINEIVINDASINTSSVLGKAILGQIVLA